MQKCTGRKKVWITTKLTRAKMHRWTRAKMHTNNISNKSINDSNNYIVNKEDVNKSYNSLT